ncbi:MAG: thioesterase family protein [Chitinophagales bacterium]|nr:thioesterase family protein [Chitinophagales bacterium]
MARIKLSFPEPILFAAEIPVRITDLNYGNHVGNDAVLGLLHEARVQFLAHYGWTELNLAGVSCIMADAALIYKSEILYTCTLSVEMSVAEASRAGFEVYYRVKDLADGSVKVIAKTAIVCYDYTARKVCLLPEAVLKQWFL